MATDVAHDEHHPTPRRYVEIAVVLSVLTALEFSTYFVDFAALHVPLLLILMAIKFALVAGWFMHLKFDTRLYTRLMFGGLGLAAVLYIATWLTIAEVPLLGPVGF